MRTQLGVILTSLVAGACALSFAACHDRAGGGDFDWFPAPACGGEDVLACSTTASCTFVSCDGCITFSSCTPCAI